MGLVLTTNLSHSVCAQKHLTHPVEYGLWFHKINLLNQEKCKFSYSIRLFMWLWVCFSIVDIQISSI